MAGSGRARDPDHPSTSRSGRSGRPASEDERYRCANCGRVIGTEDVVRIDAERRWSLDAGPSGRRRTGFVLVAHRCACSRRVLTSRLCGSYAAFVWLFGRGVRLPYVSPFRVIDLRDEDPLVRRWRFELALLEGVDDFVLWVDAERRKPLDELRRLRRATGGDGPTR